MELEVESFFCLPLAYASSRQYEIKKSVENYLVQKAQSMLDNVLGYGNSMIQVNADLNFDQVEKTMEQYDPESQVAISEQSIKANNSGRQKNDSTSNSNDNTLTNYEVSKSIQKVVEGSGNIKRLSVAAVINDIPKEIKKGEKTETVYDPRPADQMKKLEEIVRNAIGVDAQRNDQFSIVDIPFEVKSLDNVQDVSTSSVINDANEWINLAFIVFAIVASMFVLKSLMKRLKNERIVIGTVNTGSYPSAAEIIAPVARSSESKNNVAQMLATKKKKMILPVGDIEDEISDEAMLKKNQQDKIINYVTKNPMDAAKLINAWMHEDEV